MKTLIVIPCMDMVRADFMQSFLSMEKPEDSIFGMVKNTLIYNARNAIVRDAIETGVDRVMWLDSDMMLEQDTMTKLAADMDRGLDYVSGLYVKRKLPTMPVIFKGIKWNVRDDGVVETGCQPYFDYPKGELFEIAGSGFGCVMTSVKLLKALVDAYGSPFTPLMGMGEDVTFCWRAAKLGFKMYCDSRVRPGHIGEYVYREKDLRRERT